MASMTNTQSVGQGALGQSADFMGTPAQAFMTQSHSEDPFAAMTMEHLIRQHEQREAELPFEVIEQVAVAGGPRQHLQIHPHQSATNIRIDSILQRSVQGSPLSGLMHSNVGNVPAGYPGMLQKRGPSNRPMRPSTSGANSYAVGKAMLSLGSQPPGAGVFPFAGQQIRSPTQLNGYNAGGYSGFLSSPHQSSSSVFTGPLTSIGSPVGISSVHFSKPDEHFRQQASKKMTKQRRSVQKIKEIARAKQLRTMLKIKKVENPLIKEFTVGKQFENLMGSAPFRPTLEKWQQLKKGNDLVTGSFDKRAYSQIQSLSSPVASHINQLHSRNLVNQQESSKGIQRTNTEMLKETQALQTTHGSALNLSSTQPLMPRQPSHQYLNFNPADDFRSSPRLVDSTQASLNAQALPQSALRRLQQSGPPSRLASSGPMNSLRLLRSRSQYNQSDSQMSNQDQMESSFVLVKDIPRHKLLYEIEKRQRKERIRESGGKVGLAESNAAQGRLNQQRDSYYELQEKRQAASNLQHLHESLSRAAKLRRALGRASRKCSNPRTPHSNQIRPNLNEEGPNTKRLALAHRDAAEREGARGPGLSPHIITPEDLDVDLNFSSGRSPRRRGYPLNEGPDIAPSAWAGASGEAEAAYSGGNRSSRPATALDNNFTRSNGASPDSGARPAATQPKSTEGNQKLPADGYGSQTTNMTSLDLRKSGSHGEYGRPHVPANQPDLDIAQHAEFTNETLKQTQMKNLDLEAIIKRSANDMASRNSKRSGDASGGLYRTQDQFSHSRRPAFQQQNDTPHLGPAQPSAKEDSKVGSVRKPVEQSVNGLNARAGAKKLAPQEGARHGQAEGANASSEDPSRPAKDSAILANTGGKAVAMKHLYQQQKAATLKSLQDFQISRRNRDLEPHTFGHSSEHSALRQKGAHSAHSEQADNDQRKSDEITDDQLNIAESKSIPDLSSTFKRAILLSKKPVRMPLHELLQPPEGKAATNQDLKRAKPYKSQKEAFNAYTSSKAASRSREYNGQMQGHPVDWDADDEGLDLDAPLSYYVDLLQGLAFDDEQQEMNLIIIEELLKEEENQQMDQRAFDDYDFKRMLSPEAKLQSAKAFKVRNIAWRGANNRHLFQVRPGQLDIDDVSGQQKLLEEARGLKQIRRERCVQPIQLNQYNQNRVSSFIDQKLQSPGPVASWKQHDHAKAARRISAAACSSMSISTPLATPTIEGATKSSRPASPTSDVQKNQAGQDAEKNQTRASDSPSKVCRKSKSPCKRQLRKPCKFKKHKRPECKEACQRNTKSQAPDKKPAENFKDRMAALARLEGHRRFPLGPPEVPISQADKVIIARHLLDIMSDLEASGRLEEPEKKCLFESFSRYLEKISQAKRTDDDKKKRQEKVLLRGKDLRVEALQNCAEKIIHFLCMPEIKKRKSLGLFRMFMLGHIEAKAITAISLAKAQERDSQKNLEKLQLIQVAREAQQKNRINNGSSVSKTDEKDLDLPTDGDRRPAVGDENDVPSKATWSQNALSSKNMDSGLRDDQASGQARTEKPELARPSPDKRGKPAFILKDLSMCVLDDVDDSDDEVHEHFASQKTRRNNVRGQHLLEMFGINHNQGEPKYFKFNDYIHDAETLLLKGPKESDDAYEARTRTYVSPDRLRRGKLTAEMKDDRQSTILGRVMMENPDNSQRLARIEKSMALNNSGIKDLFMTGNRQRMTLEQQEYLIIDEIKINCRRIAAKNGDPASAIPLFHERYTKEMNRKARIFCEREKVNILRKVDFDRDFVEDGEEEDEEQEEEQEELGDGEEGEEDPGAEGSGNGQNTDSNAGKKPAFTLDGLFKTLSNKKVDLGSMLAKPLVSNSLKPQEQGPQEPQLEVLEEESNSDDGDGKSQGSKGNANAESVPRDEGNAEESPASPEDGDLVPVLGAGLAAPVPNALQGNKMLEMLRASLFDRVKQMKKPFIMADDTRELHASVLVNDWSNVLRLCRKDRKIVYLCNEKKQLPLFLAFKHRSTESAGILMKYGAQHVSCPEHVQKRKDYISDLVLGHLYADYDATPADAGTGNQIESATNQDLQLVQMEAIIENLDPRFDRGVLNQIDKIKNFDAHAVHAHRQKAAHDKRLPKVLSFKAFDVDLYGSQIQYIRDLILEGKIDDYEKVVRQYIALIDGKNTQPQRKREPKPKRAE